MQQVDLYTSPADAAYQGAPGAFSEEAARALVGRDRPLVPCATLDQIFEAVVDGRARFAVAAVEDAHSGSVPQVYDLILRHDLVTAGEVALNVDHVLVAPPGAKAADIRRVFSHPIALAQCADFFRRHRSLEAVSVFDTAGAVRMIVESADHTSAAIASYRAAMLYGATVLSEHIQDHPDNWTRFLLVGRAGAQAPLARPTPDRGEKALVAFTLPHRPGSLVAALQPIAEAGLSVTKIEGRPIGGSFENLVDLAAGHFDYQFVVEMTSAPGTAIPATIFAHLRRVTTQFRALGAYRI